MTVTDCPFCEIVAHRAPAKLVFHGEDWDVFGIVPLNPVVPGHVIFLPLEHVAVATQSPGITARVMEAACLYAQGKGSCNIITSVGAPATQSVYHLHIHVVPRKRDDGLMLPWGSNEAHMRDHDENAYLFYSGVTWGDSTDEKGA